MRLPGRVTRASRRLVGTIARVLWTTPWKEYNELRYWRKKKAQEGTLRNEHYRYFFTTHFGLDDAYYRGKFILDLGCGPRGSLEWASMVARRVGVDPLANEYLRLGAHEHQMEYLDAPAESIPIGDAECDVVASINSLDHVEDVDRTLSEVKRITRPGGYFLLLVEVNHPPTDCEPHQLTPRRIVRSLEPQFTCESLHVYRGVAHDMTRTLRAGVELPNPEDTRERGFLSAKFLRTPSR